MSKTETTPELDLPGIPFGILTLEQFIASSEGQEVIQTMKTMSSDPYFLMVPFLTSYQYYDMLAQLNDRAIPMKEERENDEVLLNVATRYVVEHLPKIVIDIGQEKMKSLIKMLSPEPRQ
ncbi:MULTISPECIES: hypothetical protein [Ralstonia solanacearum species complex]|uniref:hypothetical protein n=1 Tax=Ralstonia solanacearum species complex TaxID=3116862 RepID=UPI000A4E7674|nr:hypothetical protein [Ralstonia solanacearum]MDN4065630.1 hypothetical protein [Ralstonia solanacearum]NUU73379.1 hypothetical protein [Ralstonia solanacearum]QHB59501.1 hypothetical protein GRD98_10680 [Ralstonia solanacearum]